MPNKLAMFEFLLPSLCFLCNDGVLVSRGFNPQPCSGKRKLKYVNGLSFLTYKNTAQGSQLPTARNHSVYGIPITGLETKTSQCQIIEKAHKSIKIYHH